MVSNVSFNGSNYPTQNFSYIKGLSDLANYLCGVQKEREEDSPFAGFSSMIGFTAAIEAPKAIKQIYRWTDGFKNAEGFNTAWTKDMQTIKQNCEYRNALFGSGNGLTDQNAYKSFFEYTKKVKEAEEAEKAVIKLEEKSAGKGIFNKIAELFGGKAKVATRRAKAASQIGEAQIKAHEAGIAVKVLREGEKVAETAKVLTFGEQVASLGKSAIKGLKASWLFAAIEGGMETFTEIIPAFTQLGPVAGIKQIFKSIGIKTGASVGGWAAGEALGLAIGSMIFPGVGTLVGGLAGVLIGMVGGTIGSWATKKAVNAVANAINPNLTKSEVALAKEEQAKALAQQASQNPEVAQQLMQAATQKLNQEGASSEEAKLAFGSLQNFIQSGCYQAQSQSQSQPQTNTAQYAQYDPNTTGQNNPFAQQQQNYMDKDFMAMGAGLV